jgi:hypothetical protein
VPPNYAALQSNQKHVAELRFMCVHMKQDVNCVTDFDKTQNGGLNLPVLILI